MSYPFVQDNPPEQPPAGTDRLLWMVSFALRAEHATGVDGFCVAWTCVKRSALWPCRPR